MITKSGKSAFKGLLCLPLLCSTMLFGQIDGRTNRSNFDWSGLEFLSLDVAPQNAALGGASVANPKGGFLTNPALLGSQQNRLEVSLQYSPWLRALGIPSIHYAALKAGFRLNEKHAIGLTYQHFHLWDQLSGGLGDSEPFSQFSPRLYYAQQQANISWGVSLGYVEAANINGAKFYKNNRGLSVSGGISTHQKWGGLDWILALSISDYGPRQLAEAVSPFIQNRYHYLPTTFRIGGQTIIPREKAHFHLLYQFEHLLVPRNLDSINSGWIAPFYSIQDAPQGENWKEWQAKLGLEWSEIALGERLDLALRLGWWYESQDQGGRNLISSGLGFSTQNLSFDAAYWIPLNQNHPLQNTFMLSLGYAWNTRS